MTEAIRNDAPVVSDFPKIGDLKELRSGNNYSLAKVGTVDELKRYGIRHPLAGLTVQGKVFLKQPLNLTGMEISFGVMPAHHSVPFLHKHRQNEEVYVFLRGRGQMQIDGEILDVEEGTVIRVAPEGARSWRNISSEELFYIVIQAKKDSLTAWTGSDGEGVPGMVEWPGE